MLEHKSELDVIQVIVTGMFNAGKTQFIRTLSEIEVTAISKIDEPNAMAFDFGLITANEHTKIYLFGTPASRRIEKEPVERIFASLGNRRVYIVLFYNWKYQYSEEYDVWRESAVILLRLLSEPAPPVMALLNESSTHPIAFTPDTLRDKYNISSNVPIFTCNVTNAEQSKKVLLEALKLLPQDGIVRQAQEKLSEPK